MNTQVKMQLQSNEFQAVWELVKAYEALPGVVDDDYPRLRTYYESALQSLLSALDKNNRLPKPVSGSAQALNALSSEIHKLNFKWWHNEDGTPIQRNRGEQLMLIVSEIAEAMEGERKSLRDTHLPHRPMAEVELADAFIRIFDYAAGHGYDIGGAIMEKLQYNRTRADHTYEARASENGKKF